jgi:predicted transporter
MVGRVMNVIEPAITVAQVASIAIFGTLASTVFSNFHADVLGQPFDTYQALILLAGLLCILAGALTYASLRGARVASTTNPAKGWLAARFVETQQDDSPTANGTNGWLF